MLFSLVKKDFLIVKKYVGIMLIVSFLIPPIMLWRTPEAAGAMGFTLTIIFSIFMLTQYVSLKEHQYPKAATLLCATPYPRRLIVLSKYLFCLVIYAVCCLILGLTHFFSQNLERLILGWRLSFFLRSLYFYLFIFLLYINWDMKKQNFSLS